MPLCVIHKHRQTNKHTNTCTHTHIHSSFDPTNFEDNVAKETVVYMLKRETIAYKNIIILEDKLEVETNWSLFALANNLVFY